MTAAPARGGRALRVFRETPIGAYPARYVVTLAPRHYRDIGTGSRACSAELVIREEGGRIVVEVTGEAEVRAESPR